MNMKKRHSALISIFAFLITLKILLVTEDSTTNVSTTVLPLDFVRHYGSSSIPSASTPHILNFVQALTHRADADRYIILVMADEGFLDMAMNFYQASLLAYHVENFMFVGIGKKICSILSKISISCYTLSLIHI